MVYVRPPFVSERETAHTQFDGQADDPAWEDCVPCSVLMCVLAAKPGAAPATLNEAEKLRDAAGYGPLGGTLVQPFARAVKTRYGLILTTLPVGASDAQLEAGLSKGMGAVVTGRLSNFPAGHRLRRFSPGFTGGHAVYVQNLGGGDYWWMDPLGPKTGYAGERVTWAEVAKFSTSLAGAGFLPLAIVPEEDPMLPPIDTIEPITFDAPKGVQIYDEAVKPYFNTTVAINDRFSPYGVTVAGVAYRVFAGQTGEGRSLLLIREVDTTDRKAYATGASQSELEALQAQHENDLAVIKQLGEALDAAPGIERERIALAMGKAEADRVRNAQ